MHTISVLYLTPAFLLELELALCVEDEYVQRFLLLEGERDGTFGIREMDTTHVRLALHGRTLLHTEQRL